MTSINKRKKHEEVPDISWWVKLLIVGILFLWLLFSRIAINIP